MRLLWVGPVTTTLIESGSFAGEIGTFPHGMPLQVTLVPVTTPETVAWTDTLTMADGTVST